LSLNIGYLSTERAESDEVYWIGQHKVQRINTALLNGIKRLELRNSNTA